MFLPPITSDVTRGLFVYRLFCGLTMAMNVGGLKSYLLPVLQT